MARDANALFTFGGDVGPLKRSAKEGKSALADLKGEARNAAGGFAKYAAAAAAAGAALITHLVNDARQAIDHQAKMAQQLRTTSASMATLSRVSDLTGVSMQTIEKSARTLEIRMGEAEQGVAAAKDAFDALGISANDLAKLPLDQRIATVNRALADNVAESERAAVANDLFGAKMATAMKLIQPDVLERARTETERFGLALSEVDAAKVENANDALSGVQQRVKGLIQQFTVELAPIIEAVSHLLTDVGSEGKTAAEVSKDAFSGLIDVIAFVMNAADGVRRLFILIPDVVLIAFNELRGTVIRGIAAITELLAQIPGQDMFTALNETAQQKLRETQAFTAAAWENIQDTLNAPLPGDKFRDFVEEAKAASQAAAEEAVKAREAVASVVGGGEESSPELEAFDKKLEGLRERYKTELELLVEKRDQELALIAEGLELKRLGQMEHDELEAEILLAHEARKTEILTEEAKKRKALEDAAAAAKLATQKKYMGQLTTLINSDSRKLFEIGKAAALAQALVDAKASIVGAYKVGASMGGPYLGAAYAAIAAVTAYGHVRSIQSAQFGGGGGGGAGGGSVSTSINDAATPVAGAGASENKKLYVGIQEGSFYSSNQMKGMAQDIVDYTKDGGEVIVQ